MSSPSFDAAADTYDETFVNTNVGKLQRARVWNYLDSVLPDKPLNILELNCGTGEDAVWFADKGHNVTATDISDKMLEIAKNKASLSDNSNNIRCVKLDINKLSECTFNKPFDLVFSNFGGLNCLNPNDLAKFASELKNILTPSGRFIAVLMPDFCLMESIYMILKLRLADVFRRKKMQIVSLNGSEVNTFYYSPKQFSFYFSTSFKIISKIAIGFTIPPSYLNSFFTEKNSLLKILYNVEEIFGNNFIAASASDHFLIDLSLRR